MRKKRKFLIYAPSYNENNGGTIVQHKLCSLLNDLGYEAYLHQFYTRFFELDKNNFHLSIKSLLGFIRRTALEMYKNHKRYKNFKMNPSFNTQVFTQKDGKFDDDWVVVYPEITFGNPLKAKNVVRWLLHQPGFHTEEIYYTQGELLFKFNSAIDDFEFPGSTTSEHELKVIHYPLEHYNLDDVDVNRHEIAYCLRKGNNKPLQHDAKNSILIDGKSHEEIAAIFKRAKTFISYDTYTAYSIFAVLCGCESVVIPDEHVTEEEWYPNEQDRWGIAYGFEQIDHAKATAHLVLPHILEEEKKSKENVERFIVEVENFFNSTEGRK